MNQASFTIYPPIMKGATSLLPSIEGLVPKALAGDQNKFLTGGATWTAIATIADPTGHSGALLTTNGTTTSWTSLLVSGNSLKSATSADLTLGTTSFGTALTFTSATGAATFAGSITISNAAPSTSPTTGSTINSGGYAASRSSFLRGVSSGGDRTAVGISYFANQAADPAAFQQAVDLNLSASGSTAGTTSFTLGINNTVQLLAGSFTYPTVANYYAQLNPGTSVVTDAAAYLTAALTFTTSVTNGYGIKIGDVSGALNNFAIKTGTGLVSFGSTTSGTSTTAAAVLAKSLGLTENLFVGGTGNFADNISTTVIGKTILIKSGSNAKAGTFTLTSGNATVSNTSVTANSVIDLTIKTASGVSTQQPRVTATVVGTSFTVAGTGTDNGTYNYIIWEVN